MPFSKKLGECLCERCGHSWKPKPINGEYFEPKSCAGCKSKVWNQPRKYNLGKLDTSLIVTRREKATGRAAAKLKIKSKKTVEIENKVFREYETLILANQKKLKIEIRLATENGLWYVGYSIESGTYGSLCLPVRNKYRTAFESRHQALKSELKDFMQIHSDRPEVTKVVQVFFETVKAFEKFKPTIEKLHKEGFRSGGFDWWHSRFYEFVNYRGDETKEEWKRKHDLELLFPKVWEFFQVEFTGMK